jgi:DNA-binding NtrC family response regulator
MRPRVLLVEGDGVRVEAITRALGARFEFRPANGVQDARRALYGEDWAAAVAGHDPGVGLSGVEVLQIVRETAPRAFRLLCGDFSSPGLLADVRRLAQVHFVGDAHEPGFAASLERALATLLEPPSLEIPAELPSIVEDVWVARSPMGQEFLLELRVAAELEAPVYLYGEPGAGQASAARKLRQWRQQWQARGSPDTSPGLLPVRVIRVPSLRERPQDLPILAAQCLREHARQNAEPERRLSASALDVLLRRVWRGNIAELLRVLTSAAQRAGARTLIEVEDLPTDCQPAGRPSQHAKDEGQRECLLCQLRAARSVSAAARLEHCSRANYIRLMRRLGIVRADVPSARRRDGEGHDIERQELRQPPAGSGALQVSTRLLHD